MIYKLKKGSYDTYLGPSGEKMPRLQAVKLLELQVGDIIFERTDSGHGYESKTVTALTELPKKDRPCYGYKNEPSKDRHWTLTVVTGTGKTQVLGPYQKQACFNRQTSEADWRKNQKEQMIIAHRSSVRTLLGSAESSMGERPKQKYLQEYWDMLDQIRQQLEDLELRMTLDAGRDPEKDKRKLTNHRGRARR